MSVSVFCNSYKTLYLRNDQLTLYGRVDARTHAAEEVGAWRTHPGERVAQGSSHDEHGLGVWVDLQGAVGN